MIMTFQHGYFMPTCPRHKNGGEGGYVVALTLRAHIQHAHTPTRAYVRYACARVAERTKRPSTPPRNRHVQATKGGRLATSNLKISEKRERQRGEARWAIQIAHPYTTWRSHENPRRTLNRHSPKTRGRHSANPGSGKKCRKHEDQRLRPRYREWYQRHSSLASRCFSIRNNNNDGGGNVRWVVI